MGRNHLWTAYLAAGLLLVAVYTVAGSPALHGALLVGLGASSTLATIFGIVRFRPAERRIWIFVAAAQATMTIGGALWYFQLLDTGRPPPPGSVNDVFFLAFYLFFALALVDLLRRREPGASALFDATLIALAGAVPTTLVLIHPYLAASHYSALGRGVQIGSALADVLLAALVVRIVVTGVRRCTALLLLTMAVPLYLVSDLLWNWSTLIGGYTPGSWGDSGWLLCFVLSGAASLHPSMAHLGVPRVAEHQRFGRFYVFVLGLVLLAAPAVQFVERITRRELSTYASISLLAVIGLVLLARFATAVREGERLRDRLSAKNAQLAEVAAIVESSEDSITAATLAGTIIGWNPASERLYGYTAAEMIGGRIHTIVEPERHRMVDETLAALARGEPVEPHEATGVHKDGSIFPVALTVSIVRDETGAIRGVATIARDISDRRASEAERDALLTELADQNERLLELDRMKDDFVASVSHELRTPLTSIRGYLELVREDGLAPEQDRMLGVVDRNADRLLTLVTDLLFVAQVDAGKLTLERESVHLTSIAFDAVEAATPKADAASVGLHLDAVEDLVVEGDRTRLAQVFDNLISNAIKFTPDGGRVDVRIARDGDRVTVEVADTGIGIAEADRVHLFERFFRSAGATRAAVPGTGLGLAIVGAITESHGGTVTVESREGAGTTFIVSLPLAAPKLASVGPRPAAVVASTS